MAPSIEIELHEGAELEQLSSSLFAYVARDGRSRVFSVIFVAARSEFHGGCAGCRGCGGHGVHRVLVAQAEDVTLLAQRAHPGHPLGLCGLPEKEDVLFGELAQGGAVHHGAQQAALVVRAGLLPLARALLAAAARLARTAVHEARDYTTYTTREG